MKKRILQLVNRNSLLFLGGLAGVFHETVLTNTERPTLLILFAAMMGLPAFLADRDDNDDEDEDGGELEIRLPRKSEQKEHKERRPEKHRDGDEPYGKE